MSENVEGMSSPHPPHAFPWPRIFHWGSTLARRLADIELLLRATEGRLELVAHGRIVFATLANGDDPFALTWVHRRRLHVAAAELSARNVSPAAIRFAEDRLRAVRGAHRAAVRCEAFLCGRRVTVVPSRRYAWDLECAIAEVLA